MAAASQVMERWPGLPATMLVHESVVHWPGFVVLRAPLVRGRRPLRSEAIDLARWVFSSHFDSVERLFWKEAVSPQFVADVWPHLSVSSRAFIEGALSEVRLPNTGCHGDFKATNLIVSNSGDIWIIDWERYRETGSLVEDVCRLLGTVARTAASPVDVGDILASSIFREISGISGYSEHQLLLLYIISQAGCELGIRPRRKLPRKIIGRFVQRLERLQHINEVGRA